MPSSKLKTRIFAIGGPWGGGGLGFGGLGVLGFGGLGFRSLGVWSLGFRGLEGFLSLGVGGVTGLAFWGLGVNPKALRLIVPIECMLRQLWLFRGSYVGT